MQDFLALIILAVAVEGTIETIKTIVRDKKIQLPVILSMVLGVFVAIAYQIDVLALLGLVSTIPYVGMVITGLALSRGSNYVSDLITKLKGGNLNA